MALFYVAGEKRFSLQNDTYIIKIANVYPPQSCFSDTLQEQFYPHNSIFVLNSVFLPLNSLGLPHRSFQVIYSNFPTKKEHDWTGGRVLGLDKIKDCVSNHRPQLSQLCLHPLMASSAKYGTSRLTFDLIILLPKLIPLLYAGGLRGLSSRGGIEGTGSSVHCLKKGASKKQSF